jgi:hypothetical protein
MALKLIPFYGSLVGAPLHKDKNDVTQLAKHSHVLVYGAVEAHSMGEKGTCIASNKTLALETGLSISRVASILSELAAAEWIRVSTDEKGTRLYIHPLSTIAMSGNPPLPHVATPLATRGNIYNKDNTVENRTHTSKLRSDDLQASSVVDNGDRGVVKEKAAARRQIFDALVKILHPGQSMLYTKKRDSMINARLKNFKPSEMVKAAHNLMGSDWHTGNNPSNKKYASYDFLMRNDEQVEKWLNEQKIQPRKSVF